MGKPLKTFSSQQAARRVGVSYPMLLRWVRSGLIRPPGYAGRQWAAVEWTEKEIEQAGLVLSLKNLGLSAREILRLFDEHGELFEAGYKPFWIAQRMDAQGKRAGRALVLAPKLPPIDSIPRASPKVRGLEGKEKGVGTALVISHALHVPLEGKAAKRAPGERKRGK